MNTYECISLKQDDDIATISFNRPQVLNALNNQLIKETLDAVTHLPSHTRVLILRGQGFKAFAAGADLNEMQQRTMWNEIDFGPRRELARWLETAPFPTVAAINGFAFGGGFELALACHLRIASESAVLSLPETKLGILPANGGTARLTRLIGTSRALKLILMGERIEAKEAERLGIVNWVVSEDNFDEEVNAIAKNLANLAPISTRASIDSVIRGADMTINQAIENEHRWFQICLATADKKEGVEAFLQKRKPNFNQLNTNKGDV